MKNSEFREQIVPNKNEFEKSRKKILGKIENLYVFESNKFKNV